MSQKTNNMTKMLKSGESETVEFKESFSRDALESLSAFANTRGGVVLVGVNDKGAVLGTKTEQSVLKDMANQIDQGTGLQPSIKATKVDGENIVVIQVPESKIKPVMYRGRAYRRVGSTTRQMGASELTRLVLEHVGVTWDALPEPRAKISDISSTKIKSFIRKANEVGRRPIPTSISIPELLGKLDLMKDGKLTRAAVLLFGKKPQKFYSQAIIKIGRFRSETLIVDDREIEETLFDQVENTMQYFRDRLQTEFRMTGKPQRDVIWEYPLDALREAVTNAVCHRDYSEISHTQIRIYDDRILVWNPGDLPQNLSVEKLKKEHRSFPKNKLIAKMFFYVGLIEQWGSGIMKMIEETKAAGHPEPILEEDQGFRVTFGAKPVDATRHGTHHATHDTPQDFNGLTEAEKKVLEFCLTPRTRDEIIQKIGLGPQYVRKKLLPRLIKVQKLAYTLPNTPRSKKQRYVTVRTNEGPATI